MSAERARVRVVAGDCRLIMPTEGPFDMIIADPPYEDTALEWDRLVAGWTDVALAQLKLTGSMWVFGSMRYFLRTGLETGWRYAQDVVWEKPNGTGFAADRFKRVHENAVQFYRADAPWSGVYNDVQRVLYSGPDKHTRARASRTPHAGAIGSAVYEDDGLRIMRTVIPAPSVRGGLHPTEKPVALLETLIRTSCPEGGLIGDFFAGSGSAGEAAATLGRRYVGCEIDPAMADVAQGRLAASLFAGAR